MIKEGSVFRAPGLITVIKHSRYSSSAASFLRAGDKLPEIE